VAHGRDHDHPDHRVGEPGAPPMTSAANTHLTAPVTITPPADTTALRDLIRRGHAAGWVARAHKPTWTPDYTEHEWRRGEDVDRRYACEKVVVADGLVHIAYPSDRPGWSGPTDDLSDVVGLLKLAGCLPYCWQGSDDRDGHPRVTGAAPGHERSGYPLGRAAR